MYQCRVVFCDSFFSKVELISKILKTLLFQSMILRNQQSIYKREHYTCLWLAQDWRVRVALTDIVIGTANRALSRKRTYKSVLGTVFCCTWLLLKQTHFMQKLDNKLFLSQLKKKSIVLVCHFLIKTIEKIYNC